MFFCLWFRQALSCRLIFATGILLLTVQLRRLLFVARSRIGYSRGNPWHEQFSGKQGVTPAMVILIHLIFSETLHLGFVINSTVYLSKQPSYAIHSRQDGPIQKVEHWGRSSKGRQRPIEEVHQAPAAPSGVHKSWLSPMYRPAKGHSVPYGTVWIMKYGHRWRHAVPSKPTTHIKTISHMVYMYGTVSHMYSEDP
ncbi:hypothetical protein FB45DRAFT_915180 [Roridomyces roridus]|uniref:Uncharacterized protein n=1 Tax=Roridomyces roridus TaxID=1738132 RepID=A0AAD7BUB3_9AGAR|nr:hypothetical protein FB45DRAFT_915180 [Roridomyces roridus]